MRVSEILGLTWGVIDFRTGNGVVLQAISQQGDLSTPKSVRGRRTFELGPLTKRFIQPSEAQDGDLIWPEEDQRALQHRLARRAHAVGLYFKGFGFHTLRRTYATLRDSLGARKPDAALVAAMGHTTGSMTEHYIDRNDTGVVEKLIELVNFSGVSREDCKPN
jgi:integrase